MTWRILLVDDDQDDFFLTYGMLKSGDQPVELVWRSSFEAGIEALEDGEYEAALIDYDLGPQTGIDFIRRANQMNLRFPMILYTGRTSRELDQQASEAGATLYLTKSETNPLLLERIIRFAIDHKQRELALRLSQAEFESHLEQCNQALGLANQRLKTALSHHTAQDTALLAARQMNDMQDHLIESLLGSLAHAAALFDTHFHFLHVNQAYARLSGREASTLRGQDLFKLYPSSENETIFRQVLASGHEYSASGHPFAFLRNPEESNRHWQWRVQPINDAGGRVIYLLLTLRVSQRG